MFPPAWVCDTMASFTIIFIKKMQCEIKYVNQLSCYCTQKQPTLSQCSMNSARFSSVCIISGISCDVKACSRFWANSSCSASDISVQHETKATLKSSLIYTQKKRLLLKLAGHQTTLVKPINT